MDNKMDKKEALLIQQNYLKKLPDIIQYLQELKEQGKNVYTYFKGHRLYSADITEESAYLEVVGLTRDEVKKYNMAIKKYSIQLNSYFDQLNEEQNPVERRNLEKRIKDVENKIKELQAEMQSIVDKRIKEKRKGAIFSKKKFASIDEAVDYLQDCKRDGLNVFIVFEGCKLYSADATVKTAQKSVHNAQSQTGTNHNEINSFFDGSR